MPWYFDKRGPRSFVGVGRLQVVEGERGRGEGEGRVADGEGGHFFSMGPLMRVRAKEQLSQEPAP